MGSQPSRTSFLLLLHKMMMMMMMKHLLKSSMPNFFERRKRKKSVRVAVPNWLALSHSSSCCWRSQHCWAAAIHQLPAPDRIQSMGNEEVADEISGKWETDPNDVGGGGVDISRIRNAERAHISPS